MEEMAVEEQEVMQECKMAEKQRVRWADVEDAMKSEKGEELANVVKRQVVVVETETELIGQVTVAGKDGVKGETGEKRETAEEREQMIKKRFTETGIMGVSNLCLACGVPGLQSSQVVGLGTRCV